MYMHELKEKLCEELEEIARKPEMSAGDLEAAHKLTDTIKNIDKIEMLEEDGGYSRAGDWEADMRGTMAAAPATVAGSGTPWDVIAGMAACTPVLMLRSI